MTSDLSPDIRMDVLGKSTGTEYPVPPAAKHNPDLPPEVECDLSLAAKHDLSPLAKYDLASEAEHDLSLAAKHDLTPVATYDLASEAECALSLAAKHDLSPTVKPDLSAAATRDKSPIVGHDPLLTVQQEYLPEVMYVKSCAYKDDALSAAGYSLLPAAMLDHTPVLKFNKSPSTEADMLLPVPIVLSPLDKRRHQEIPQRVKRYICQLKMDNPSVTFREIRNIVLYELAIDVGKSTVGDIIKRKERWLATPSYADELTRIRPARYEQMEEDLMVWYSDLTESDVAVSDKMMIEQARELGTKLGINDFLYSRGWLNRFKERQGMYKLDGYVQGYLSSVTGIPVRLSLKIVCPELSCCWRAVKQNK